MLLQMEHIAPLKDIKSLTILNLMGNPLERKNGFKKLMKQTFPQVKGYTFPEAYVTLFADSGVFRIQQIQRYRILH